MPISATFVIIGITNHPFNLWISTRANASVHFRLPILADFKLFFVIELFVHPVILGTKKTSDFYE